MANVYTYGGGILVKNGGVAVSSSCCCTTTTPTPTPTTTTTPPPPECPIGQDFMHCVEYSYNGAWSLFELCTFPEDGAIRPPGEYYGQIPGDMAIPDPCCGNYSEECPEPDPPAEFCDANITDGKITSCLYPKSCAEGRVGKACVIAGATIDNKGDIAGLPFECIKNHENECVPCPGYGDSLPETVCDVDAEIVEEGDYVYMTLSYNAENDESCGPYGIGYAEVCWYFEEAPNP